jgi:hypothetical protein
MKKSIAWQKYECPLNSNISDNDSNINVETNVRNFEDNDYIAQGVEDEQNVAYGLSNNKVIMTPFGLLSIMDGTLAAHHFDFWIMHTNFDITQSIVDKITPIPGVESVEVLSRYRIRIGFPIGETVDNNNNRVKMFDSALVKHEIEQTLLSTNFSNIEIDTLIKNLFDNNTLEHFLVLKSDILSTFSLWAVYILPNGKIEFMATEAHSDYNIKYNILYSTQKLIGGYLLTHKDYITE